MPGITRRSLINRSVGLVAAGALARPYIANAQAKTAEVWWVQGFVPDEDVAFRAMAAEYEKQSGDKLNYSIIPFAPMRQKIVSAITSGVVPDLILATPPEIIPEQAWAGNLIDVTDIVETQKAKMLPIGPASAFCYDNVAKKRSYYGVPLNGAVIPFHIWGDLVEKAGFKVSDIPNTWDAFIDFFKPVQKKLQELGMRHTYATGFVVSTIGNDPTNTFDAFMIAYGGEDIVTSDGKFNGRNPQVHDAVIRAVDRLANLYKDGYIPPSSINWNDADDNNAFHSKLCVMDFDGTLSTELAMIHDQQAYYHDMLTIPPPLDNNGKKMVSQLGIAATMIPKGAKNEKVAKEFQTFLITPENNIQFLKGALGRFLPISAELIKEDTWWSDTKRDPHVPPYIEQGVFSPTKPDYFAYNPAWAQVRSEHPFNVAFHDVVADGKPVKEASMQAIKRVEEIFAKYRIQA